MKCIYVFYSCCMICILSIQSVCSLESPVNLSIPTNLSITSETEPDRAIVIHNETLSGKSREKRYTTGRYGMCDTIETFRSQGLEVLQELSIQREQFYIKPKASFSRVVIQASLDNHVPYFLPRVYDNRVEFLASDLPNLSHHSSEWIEVVAEIRQNIIAWELRLRVEGWKDKVTVRHIGIAYKFHQLVISGEGGCEWSFHCQPDADVGRPRLRTDSSLGGISQYSVWWMILTLTLLALFCLIVCCGICCCGCYRRKEETNDNFISRSMSFRRPRRRPREQEEDIYEEIGMTALQKLERKYSSLGLYGYDNNTPPPLPPPNNDLYAHSIPNNLRNTVNTRNMNNSNRSIGNRIKYSISKNKNRDFITTVLPPTPLFVPRVCEVQDHDWYGSLELPGSDHSRLERANTVDCGALGPRCQGASENIYSNNPTFEKSSDYDTYVDMSKIKRFTTK